MAFIIRAEEGGDRPAQEVVETIAGANVVWRMLDTCIGK